MEARAIGTYEPLIPLASGGMASVHIARQVTAAGIERLVLMKRVHPHLLSNREFCEMLLDEGRIASLIRHPNVASVVDVAEIAGELCLVQEYIESVSLSDLIKAAKAAGERIRPAVSARIVCDLLAGLHAAHGAADLRGRPLNVVHRDVSPSNVVVGLDGISRLIDFGISKAATKLAVTDSGVVKGKFAYMAPEQLKQRPVDRRADVFSASAVLYHALTGTPPFGSGSDGDTVLRVLVGGAQDPSSLAAEVPKALDAVVQRGLAGHPDERFATAADFRGAIEDACPPASVEDVAGLVEHLGGDVLARRREQLKERIEQRTRSALSLPTVPEIVVRGSETPTPGPAQLGSSSDRVDVASSGRQRTATKVVVFGLGSVIVIAATTLVLRHERPSPSSTAGQDLAPAAASSPAAPLAPPSASPSTDDSVPAAQGSSAISPSATSRAPRSQPSRPQQPSHPARNPSDLHRTNPYLTQ